MKLAKNRILGAGVCHPNKGMTLVEITIYLFMTMVLSATLLMLLQSHFAFMRILTRFEFLRDDAPQINTMLTGIFGKADSYRVYGSKSSAQAGGSGAVTTGGTAVRLNFRNPDGTETAGVVAFETVSGKEQLNYYGFDGSTWNTWTISSRPDNVTFANNTGILVVTMTGPEGGQITYGGTGE